MKATVGVSSSPRRIVVCLLLLWIGWGGTAQSTYAQTFFASPVTDPVVGADRGSASRIRKLDDPTGFLTFSNTGSEEAGRFVVGLGYALPNVAVPGDQFDVTAVWAGPPENGWRELLAGGAAYRFPVRPANSTLS